jgi:hypothetical protein
MHGELLALAVETGAALMVVIMEADVTAAHGPKPSLIRTGRPCGTATNPARSGYRQKVTSSECGASTDTSSRFTPARQHA